MNRLKNNVILTFCVVAVGLGTNSVMAQDSGGEWDSVDLTPVYQHILESQRQSLSVTNDSEWMVISPKLLKLVRLKLEAHAVETRGLFGRMGSAGSGNPVFELVLDGTLPDIAHKEEDALNKAIADNSPIADINAALAKVKAVRQQRQADMTKAQSDLREVLTPRQAAVLVSRGMLD